jgi:hypothetical protein
MRPYGIRRCGKDLRIWAKRLGPSKSRTTKTGPGTRQTGAALAFGGAFFLGAFSVGGANANEGGVIFGSSNWEGKTEMVPSSKNIPVPEPAISDWIWSGRDRCLSNWQCGASELIDATKWRGHKSRSQISGLWWQICSIDNKDRIGSDCSLRLSIILDSQNETCRPPRSRMTHLGNRPPRPTANRL